MKIKIVFSVLVLGAIVALSMFYLNGSAGAATTGPVSPSVTVDSTLSLTIENGTNVQWGSKAAGTTQTGTIQAVIGANTGWNLTVQATAGYPGTNELVSESNRIVSSRFKYTSAAGSSAPSGSGVPTPTAFDGLNQTSVWTGGGATDQCQVAITYSLQIPLSQPTGTYTATHTYTLTQS